MQQDGIRIGIDEVLDIVGYSIGDSVAKQLRAHYKKYGDWGRVKELIILEIIQINAERIRLRNRNARLEAEAEERKQLSLL